MPFTQTHVTSVAPPQISGRELVLSWTLDTPGLPTQVYIGGVLSWYGTASSCRIPLPASGEDPLRIDIGTVDAGEIATDFSSSLPPPPKRRATLSWVGGTFEGTDLAGYRIYGSATPGGPINDATPIGSVAANPGGISIDGWGMGPWGGGVWGSSGVSYSWVSDSLASGTWLFAVVPYDTAGNMGSPQTCAVVINAPPSEPPAFSDGSRLHYQLIAWGNVPWGVGGWGEPEIRLIWNASSP